MWEEFTQSIHYFVEDKKNLALHTQGKKKAHPIVIPSIRFTKLIIHHLQSKHKFHPRPNSPLHLPYEEYILGYLKFSNKGTKREVFGMPIPNELITADIRATPVTKLVAAKASESTVSQQPKPKPAPAKTQEKKHKLVVEKSNEPSPAKSSKPGKRFREREKRKCTPAPTEPLGHAESPLIYAKLGLTDSDTESGKEMPHVVKIGAQDEGQARPNPGVLIEGQAGSNPGDDAEPQPQSNPVVHARPDLEHMDLEATDVSTQQNPEQMDEGFTTTA
nr:hypothetical protein [Tanacetum cinerariifolium]